MPMQTERYPANWSEIAHEIKDACGWQCQLCGKLTKGNVGPVYVAYYRKQLKKLAERKEAA